MEHRQENDSSDAEAGQPEPGAEAQAAENGAETAGSRPADWQAQVFAVKRGTGRMYIVITGKETMPFIMTTKPDKLKLALLLSGARDDTEAEAILRAAPEFTVSEFLAFARTHPILQTVENWGPLEAG